MDGDADEGVRLTLEGVNRAMNDRERLTAYSNLCAGYIMLEQLEDALFYCDMAIELNDRHWRSYNNRALVYLRMKRYRDAARDIERGQAINPDSSTLKKVRGMLLDETDPVEPSIVIDDRREPGSEDE